ncbi:MAG TPA: hypothetical protein PLV56_08305, partial [Synergistales bacterium]|nr:hypothetical protein [Synergistales bacterium]
MGLLAQNIFPGGIDLKPKTPFQYPQALSNTAGAMDDSSVKVIYEASFQYEGVLVVTDILTRDGNGWVAYEVKSSAEISETFREDIALQYFVLSNSGVKLIDFRILYLNKDYKGRPHLELKELFLDESLMEDALSRQDKVQKKVMELTAVTRLSSSPKIATGTHCLRPYPCDFIGHCWKGKPPRTSFPGDAPVDTDLLQQTFQAHQPGMAYLE